jgi:putative two-component system response regulator
MTTDNEAILVVDDEAPLRELIALTLRKKGHEATAVVDADAALDALGKSNVPLMLVDVRMPGKDGLWLLEQVRSGHPDTAVIMVTAVADVHTAVDCLRRGATDYLIKPVASEVLLRTVDRALSERQMKLELARYRENLEETVEEQSQELRAASEKFRQAMEATIGAIAKMSEMNDPYNTGHQRRVALLADAIAREMGLSEDQRQGVHVSASLHDIGMTVVPRSIRSKLGRLSSYEFKIVMTHPEAGYDILEGLEFAWPVADAVLEHHERLDGSGYPDGLKGEEIILEARILAVADTVEAMMSNRPYRPPAGREKAVEQILKNRDVLFDPQVVDACMKLFADEGFDFGGGDDPRDGGPAGVHAPVAGHSATDQS